jgi:hypothetical protein
MTTVGAATIDSSPKRYAVDDNADSGVSDDAFSGILDAQQNSEIATSMEPNSSTTSDNTALNLAGLQGKLAFLNKIDIPETAYQRTWEMSDDVYNERVAVLSESLEMQKNALKAQYTSASTSDPSIAARTADYATVTVDGNVIAKIDNQGGVESSDSDSLAFQKALLDTADTASGPDLAQTRAEKIAAILGGTVQKASTAMTQSAFDTLPSLESLQVTDTQAMESDPRHAELQKEFAALDSLMQKRAEYLAQQQAA